MSNAYASSNVYTCPQASCILNTAAGLPTSLLESNNTADVIVVESSIIDCPREANFIPMRYSTDAFHLEPKTTSNCSLTYKLNNSKLITNFETGWVQLAYEGIPVDEDGFPMIPDQIKHRMAVAAYLKWKIAMLKWTMGKMPAGVFQHFEREKDWYIGAAQTATQIMGVDHMESIKNNWIRLIPKINQHRDGFKNAGEAEHRTSHNTRNNSRGRGGNSNDTYYYSS